MIYGSVCDGISGAAQAWDPLGWRCAWRAEIEPFADAVARARRPELPNLGDFTRIGKEVESEPIGLLAGGTPCQDFSVAGKRAGLDAPRGNLTLEYLALAARLEPRWLVWENVPGVLSLGEGRVFGAILGILGQLGYGWCYRVLDAQYDGLAQRRERVFLVGHLGDWRPAAEVLFEPTSLSGHPAPGREAGPVAAAVTANGAGACGADDNSAQAGHLIAHTLSAEGFDASEDGTGRGSPLVAVAPMAFSCKDDGGDARPDQSPTLRAMNHDKSHANAGGQVAIAFNARQDPVSAAVCPPLDTDHFTNAVAYGGNDTRGPIDVATACNAHGGPHGRQDFESETFVAQAMTVRRLTPREWERLQGFPDDYTRIAWRGKPPEACPDGPRYRALGNAWPVPVARWIGRRLAAVAGRGSP